VDAPINDPTADQTTRRIASLREQLADGRHLRFDEEIVPYVDGDLAAGAKEAVEAAAKSTTCGSSWQASDALRHGPALAAPA
jgi:hypothetical protein